MTYLLLTIFLNVFIFVLFKFFPKYGVDNLQAIVVNYITCVVTGSLFLGYVPFSISHIAHHWFYWSLAMGGMFIFIFNFIAYSIKKSGLTATTVANKLSLAIPVFFSVWLYQERMNTGKLLGILLAFPAVYFTTKTNEEQQHKKNVLLPLLLFAASGSLDTIVKYVEHHFLDEPAIQAVYLIHVFAMAAIIGIGIIFIQKRRNKIKLQWKNVFAGIILGVPNYFSMYFFVRLLNDDFLQSSAAIPVNNMGIVLLSSLIAIFFFKERTTKMRIAGLVLSILSILLIFYGDMKNG